MTTTSSPHAPLPSTGLNQDRLKRTIGLPGALAISVNQIIGGGIVSLTGVAIAMTGGGVSIAYVVAAFAVIVSSIPYAALAAAMPVAGGTYAWPARVIHPAAGFFLAWLMALGKASLSLYGLSAGQYLHAINPVFDETVVAVVLITIFFLTNLAGAVFSSRVGFVMMIVMLIGFMVFAIPGLAAVDWQLYPEAMPEGLVTLLSAAALLSFATAGAYGVGELGREMKNPGRDIPIAMIGGTGLVGVVYVLVALPAAGVLPIPEVAGEPLSTVAAQVLPRGLWVFFIVAGALTAIVSTMNAELLWGTKALLAASDDGWLPRRLGAVNRRFGTPHWLLLVLYLVGILPALARLDISVIGTAASVFVQMMFLVIVITSLYLRRRLPALHAASPFRLPLGLHVSIVVVAVGFAAYQGYLLMLDFDARVWGAVTLWMALGAVIAVVRWPAVRKLLRERAAQEVDASPEAAAGRSAGEAAGSEAPVL